MPGVRIFGAVGGGGSAVGLFLGGFLAEWLSWRWCLYVNLVFAAVAVAGVVALLRNSRTDPRTHLAIPARCSPPPPVCLVFGFSHAATSGWTEPLILAALVAAAALLSDFVLVQKRVQEPVLPLRVVLDRVRGTCYTAVGLSAVAILAVFLFLTYYLQQVQGLPTIVTGLAFPPRASSPRRPTRASCCSCAPRSG